MAYRILLRQVSRGDIIVAMTDPPLLSIVAQHVAARRGAKLINWLQDVYPEVAIGLGVPLSERPNRNCTQKVAEPVAAPSSSKRRTRGLHAKPSDRLRCCR